MRKYFGHAQYDFLWRQRRISSYTVDNKFSKHDPTQAIFTHKNTHAVLGQC